MKKLLITLFLAFAMLPVIAQKAWTVEMVPNTRLQSNSIHVSDPDNYLSPEAEMRINTALCAIRDTADVFLVALESIGYEEPADFRTKLFNKWGIGDKGKDNGLLMLFVEDQHAFEFEVGYGIEPVIPDIKCFEIFNHTIKPYFKNGDYEGGMVAGVMDIVDVFGVTVPAELVTVLPDDQVYKDAKPQQAEEEVTESDLFILIWLLFLIFFPLISATAWVFIKIKERKTAKTEIKDDYTISEVNGVKYLNDLKTTWSGSPWHGIGCLRSLTFGFSGMVWFILFSQLIRALFGDSDPISVTNCIAVVSILAYLTWICWRNNVRTLKMADKVAKDSLNPRMVYEKAKKHPRTVMLNYLAYWIGRGYLKKYDALIAQSPVMLCPECRQPMTDGEDVKLGEIEEAEKAHKVWRFTSLRCPTGHAYVIKERGEKYDSYFDCDNCGAHLKRIIHTMTLTKPTYSHSGLEEVVSECEFCHKQTAKKVVIPRLERSSSSSSSGSSSRSSGGSFGGGRSGGGGYSGKW